MGTLLGLFEFELRAPVNDLVSELDKIGNDVLKRKRARTAPDKGNVVHGETGLEGSVFKERIEHHIGICVLLDDKLYANALAVGKFPYL